LKIRKKYGDKNLIGKNVAALRKSRKIKQHELLAQLQVKGINITASGLSELEGQNRYATDKEVFALMTIFNVSFEELCKNTDDT